MKLFKKRTLWLPTWPVVLVGGLLFFVAGGLLFFGSHDFLAVEDRAAGAEVLVVESWLDDESLRRVAELLNEEGSPYREAWLAGTKISHGGLATPGFDTYNERAAETLKLLGVEPARLRVAPGSARVRHRTHSAASDLKAALDAAGGDALPRFDLASFSVHSRRSRLVYEKVFPAAEVGVIALPNPEYGDGPWFKTSAGVKNTIFETVAYLYEKLADGGR